jgi:hypothetical protein
MLTYAGAGQPVPFSVKVFHAQQAGAVGVIFMDNNRGASMLEKLPRIGEVYFVASRFG